MAEKTSIFQKAIETVEALSPDEQEVLIDIIQKRLRQQRRDELLKAVAEAENNYVQCNIRRGSVSDLLAELEN